MFILTAWIELAFSLTATPLVLLYLYALLTSALNYGIKILLTANGLGLLFLTTSHVAVAVCRLVLPRELGEDAVANLPLFLHQIAYGCCNVSQLLITMERMVIGRFPRLYVNAHASQPLVIGICVLAQVFITLPCAMLVQDGPVINGRKIYAASELTQKISVVLSASISASSLLMVVASFSQSSQRYNKAFFKATLGTRHQVKEVISLTRVLIPVCCSSLLLKFIISTLAYMSYGNVRNLDALFTAIRFLCTASAVIEPVLFLSRHRLLQKRLRRLFGLVENKIHPSAPHDPVTVADVYFAAFNKELNRRSDH